MSKELEALEKFLDDYLTLCEKLHTNRQEKMLLDKNSPYNVLKTYLQFINNTEPSEALKCLECLYCESDDYRSVDKAKCYETIKQALLNVEKELKALEIIKNKLVDVFKLYNCKTIEEYNQAQYRDCMLTKEEFNLLKEVLE